MEPMILLFLMQATADNTSDFMTCDELLKIYFDTSSGQEISASSLASSLDSGLASSVLDALLSVQSFQMSVPGKQHSLNPPLWTALKMHFSVFVDILNNSQSDETAHSAYGNSPAEKVKGKRKEGSSKATDTAKRSRAFVNTAPDGEAFRSIPLLTTLLAGNSDAAAEFRDQTLASEEDFSHLVDIFAIMQ
jgi:hypothetical protein